MDARTQRIRDAIARLEDVFPPHQARAIIGYAEALGSEPRVARDTEPAPGEQTLAQTLLPFRQLPEMWQSAAQRALLLSDRELLRSCAADLRSVIERAETGNV